MAVVRTSISETPAQSIATVTLSIDTAGEGFVEITREAARFIADVGAREGALFLFIRHTSASLIIQENADPDVRTDLVTALHRLAPSDGSWVHDTEGPDDMPAHVKSSVMGCSVMIPVREGRLALGTWQGIYLGEHRSDASRRTIVATIWGEG
jgi:secondary thiamine-phosphate synthase enzyme